MLEFVTQPNVRLVAHTVMDPHALDLWAEEHGLSDALHGDTPLGKIHNDVDDSDWKSLDALPEFGGRFCYRSWEKGRTREAYLQNVIEMEHGSILEHSVVSFAVSGVSRSFSHELVRHRQGASPSQESQRYVDAKDIRFIVPPLVEILSKHDPLIMTRFKRACAWSLSEYVELQDLLREGLAAASTEDVKLATMAKKRVNEAARALLPNASETRLLWTMNLRAARHVCSLRGSEHADLEIRRVAVEFTKVLKTVAPHCFADFEIVEGADGLPATKTPYPKI
jgi:thymidylate synthase (FAD)